MAVTEKDGGIMEPDPQAQKRRVQKRRLRPQDMAVIVLGIIAALSIVVIALQAIVGTPSAPFEQLAAIATACVAGIAGLVQSRDRD